MYVKNAANKKKLAAYALKKRRLTICLIVLAAILITVLILVFRQPSVSELMKKQPFIPDNEKAALNAGIVYENGVDLMMCDYSGNSKWSIALPSADPAIYSSDSSIALAENNTAWFYSSEGKLTFEKTVEGKIKRIVLNAKSFAVFYEGTSGSHLLILKSTGEEVCTYDFENQVILDFGFYQSGEEIWILSLDTTGVTPLSRLTTYKPGISLTGSLELKENLVDDIYIYGNRMYVFSTSWLTTYDLYGKSINSTLIYSWKFKDAVISSGKPYFVCTKRSDDETLSLIKIISPGVSGTDINLPSGILGTAVYKGKIYCYSASAVYRYSLSGTLEQTRSLGETYEQVEYIKDHLLFSKNGEVFSYPLN